MTAAIGVMLVVLIGILLFLLTSNYNDEYEDEEY